jgi:RNA polymerase sigma-70 factor, ECF subfamily
MDDGGVDVEALYRRFGPMVLRRCRRLLRNEDDALEVAQEVFVSLVRNRRRLDDRFPSSLLFRMATNLSLNRIRDRRYQPLLPGDEVLHRIAGWKDLDAPLLLHALFRHQPASTRTMAVVHFVDGLTLEQVARIAGLSVSGVRKRLRGLRARLEALTERGKA